MPLFVLYGRDIAGGVELRKATRAAHLEWIESLRPRVKLAGPMFAEDGATPAGSVMIIEADSLDAAKADFARDPYALAGLWASADISAFNWVVSQPMFGALICVRWRSGSIDGNCTIHPGVLWMSTWPVSPTTCANNNAR